MSPAHHVVDPRWQVLVDLLIARHAAVQEGLEPRDVHDLIWSRRRNRKSVEGFAAAYDMYGAPVRGAWRRPYPLSLWLDGGWPVTAYATLAEAGDMAVARGAYVARGVSGLQATRALVGIAETAGGKGARWGEIAGWIEVLAQITDPFVADVIWAGIVNWNERRPGQGLEIDQDECPAEWAAALGEAAPWVWAAGIPFTEAVQRHRAGTLSLDGLRMFAGLRGYRSLSPAGGAPQ